MLKYYSIIPPELIAIVVLCFIAFTIINYINIYINNVMEYICKIEHKHEKQVYYKNMRTVYKEKYTRMNTYGDISIKTLICSDEDSTWGKNIRKPYILWKKENNFFSHFITHTNLEIYTYNYENYKLIIVYYPIYSNIYCTVSFIQNTNGNDSTKYTFDKDYKCKQDKNITLEHLLSNH